MVESVLRIATSVATPLALAGLIVGVLFLILRQILRMPIFSGIGASATAKLISRIVTSLAWLAVVALALAFLGYVLALLIPRYYPQLDPDYVDVGIAEDQSLENLCKALAISRQVTVAFAPSCSDETKQTMVEAGSYGDRSLLLLLEQFRERSIGPQPAYHVEKKGAKRYEILCP